MTTTPSISSGSSASNARTGGVSSNPALTTNAPDGLAVGAGGDVNAPSGGVLYRVQGGPGGQDLYYLMYDVGDGVKAFYAFDTPGMMVRNVPPPQTISFDAWNHMVNDPGSLMANAGSVRQLGSISDQTYQGWFTRMVNMATGGAEWINDPQVREIYTKYLLGVIGQQELQYALQGTTYFTTHTQKALDWATQSAEADRAGKPLTSQQQQDVADAASQLVQLYNQDVGQQLAITDPDVQKFAASIASGALTQSQVFEQWIKPAAMGNPQSPLAIELGKEANTGRQQVGDAVGQVRQLYLQWGQNPPSQDRLNQLGQQMADGSMTTEQLTETLRSQAKVMYPWIDPNVDVATQAQPWMDAYQRILEKPATITTPDVQSALTSGMPVYRFEQQLRSKPEWLQTQNATQDMTSAFGRVASQMGFE